MLTSNSMIMDTLIQLCHNATLTSVNHISIMITV